MPKVWKTGLMLFAACCLSVSQPLWANVNSGLVLVGQGQMSWMFFDLYQARFYSLSGRYQAGSYPQALILSYQKNISQADLVEATVSEWQRLGIDYPASWPRQLGTLWPSVKKGDVLAIRVEATGESRFYFNQVPLGEVSDPQFGPAFLAIWLSENSQDPGLTRQLTGH